MEPVTAAEWRELIESAPDDFDQTAGYYGEYQALSGDVTTQFSEDIIFVVGMSQRRNPPPVWKATYEMVALVTAKRVMALIAENPDVDDDELMQAVLIQERGFVPSPTQWVWALMAARFALGLNSTDPGRPLVFAGVP